jgi:alpha-beta hydrolase superfamily lysophospholipase
VPSKLKDSGLNGRVFSYGYDSSTAFSKAVIDITDEAAMLLDRIKGERKSQAERHRPIILIAHSLGGILVKKVRVSNASTSRRYVYSVS